jgi:two-component system, response regulator PdtaR
MRLIPEMSLYQIDHCTVRSHVPPDEFLTIGALNVERFLRVNVAIRCPIPLPTPSLWWSTMMCSSEWEHPTCSWTRDTGRVLEAGNADEALQFFETNPDVRLLFTDVSMPGSMSGSALAHQVAKRWPGVGIIMTSGRPRPEPLPLGTQFHAKPYEPTNVLQHAREMTCGFRRMRTVIPIDCGQ